MSQHCHKYTIPRCLFLVSSIASIRAQERYRSAYLSIKERQTTNRDIQQKRKDSMEEDTEILWSPQVLSLHREQYNIPRFSTAFRRLYLRFTITTSRLQFNQQFNMGISLTVKLYRVQLLLHHNRLLRRLIKPDSQTCFIFGY